MTLRWHYTFTDADPDQRAELDGLLDLGWEPFAVTEVDGGLRVHLRIQAVRMEATDRTCAICGTPLYRKAGPGRPPKYCPTHQQAHLFGPLERMTET